MSGWSAALRIARRDALRHPGRSLLVMSLIALPILATVSADIVIRSGVATQTEKVDSQLAGADAWIIAPEGVRQFSQQLIVYGSPPIQGQGVVTRDDRQEVVPVNSFPARPASQVLPLLPQGTQITPWQHIDAVPVRSSSSEYVSAAADILDITSPAAGGRYTVTSGTAPTPANEVAITSHLASRLHLAVGDAITAGAPAQLFTISGIVRAAATGGSLDPPGQFDAVVALPGTLRFVQDPLDGPRYLVISPKPITTPMINRLNSEGVGVYSRAAVLNTPAQASADPNASTFMALAGVAVGVVMAVLQIVFLAGPAFAIGARRMRRQLGLLTAAGGTAKHLRTVVMASGVVLGAAGAVLGLLVGVGLGVAVRQLFQTWLPGYRSLGVHLHPGELLGIAVVGFITALLAALVPAIMAGRSTPLSLLGRQPATTRPVRWWSLAGAIVAAAGVVVTIWMAISPVPDGSLPQTARNRGIGLAAGSVMVEVGLLLTVPLLVRWLSRLGSRMPISGRLAFRDSERHRSRTAPGIAAITAAATLAVLAGVMYSSSGADAQEHYQAGLPIGQVDVRFAQPEDDAPSLPSHVDIADAQAVVRSEWPDARSVSYAVVDDDQHNPQIVTANGGVEGQGYQRGLIIPADNICPYTEIHGYATDEYGQGDALTTTNVHQQKPTGQQLTKASTDWRCYGRSYSRLSERTAHVHRWATSRKGYENRNIIIPTIVVGGPDLRRQLTGIPDPAADATLASGGAVVLDRTYLATNGTISSGVQTGEQGPDGPVTKDIRTVRAILGAWSPTPLGVILSPQAAHALGWTPQPGGLIVNPGTAASQDQADQLALALQAATGTSAQATAETGRMPNLGNSTRTAMTVLLIIIGFLIAGTIIVVTALSLADARPDLATLAAVGAAPRIRRLVTGWTAGLVTFLGCLLGGAIGLVPAWGLLRLIQIVSAPYGDPIIVPWGLIVPLIVVIPLAAFVTGTLLPRSRLPLVARVE